MDLAVLLDAENWAGAAREKTCVCVCVCVCVSILIIQALCSCSAHNLRARRLWELEQQPCSPAPPSVTVHPRTVFLRRRKPGCGSKSSNLAPPHPPLWLSTFVQYFYRGGTPASGRGGAGAGSGYPFLLYIFTADGALHVRIYCCSSYLSLCVCVCMCVCVCVCVC